MIPAAIDGANRTFTRPQVMTRDECGDLKVRVQRYVVGDGACETFAFSSAWTPTPDELAKLVAGANVELTIIGMTHPPIAIRVGDAPP